MRKEVKFKFERATKNTFRFQEDTTLDPVIGTLYVKKSLFKAEPQELKVTIETERD